MSEDSLGDRMKSYEAAQCDARLSPRLPIIARIDGRTFSTFTRGLEKPFCRPLSQAMNEVCAALVDKTHARLGYTQSDEISLVYLTDNPEGSVVFDGRVQKLTSVLASLAAAQMARSVGNLLSLEYGARLPHFDCRVMQVPSRAEATNAILWRWKDARKNAISSLAQAHFSPKKLHGLHGGEMLALLKDVGVIFDDWPSAYKSGTFWRRESDLRELTAAELARIPEKHRPLGPVERTAMRSFHVDDFLSISHDEREAIVFSTLPTHPDRTGEG